MSREIKFRAWDKGRDCWLKPFEGVDPESGRAFYVEFGGTFEFPDPRTVALMQYTGLKDKNGVEIYEGDIVRIKKTRSYGDNGGVRQVVFEYGMFGALLDDGHVMLLGGNQYNSDDIEVIGNIYENPELLGSRGGDA